VTESAFSVAFSMLLISGSPSERTDYVARLKETLATADAQYRLAVWAKKQGLKDEADGHLRAAIHLDPDYVPAHKALGRAFNDGLWETKREREDRLAAEKRFNADRREWSQRLRDCGIAKALEGRRIDEAAAAAIEGYAAGDRNRLVAAISRYKEGTHVAATLALVRLAVASTFDEIRPEAVKALADKSPDHYLPPLIEFVRPLDSRIRVILGVGEVWSWRDSESLYLSLPPTSVAQGLSSPDSKPVDLHDESAHRQAQSEFQHKNAVAALQKLTGAKIGDDFLAWSQVAFQITGRTTPRERGRAKKTIRNYYEPDVVRIGSGIMPIAPPPQQAPETPAPAPPPNTGPRMRYKTHLIYSRGVIGTPVVVGYSLGPDMEIAVGPSCFAAGTPVSTKRGLISIDDVCIGELVLSRNVATGETGYKPVLTRTLLPARDMRRLHLGDDSVLSTMAHPFWSPTRGWVKAMDLSHGTPLAAQNGLVAMGRNEPADQSQAYNLVVADWSTYFVGKSRVLVHDNTPIRDLKPTEP